MPPDWLLLSRCDRWPLLGLCVGSFLNVVIHRLPLMLERGWRERRCAELRGEAPVRTEPRAYQPRRAAARAARRAATRSRWYENIPLVSWLGCAAAARLQAPISARYPLVEVLRGRAVRGACGWRFGAQPHGAAAGAASLGRCSR